MGEIMIDRLHIDSIKKLIRMGCFTQADVLLGNNKEDLTVLIFELGCDDKSICSYSFICFLLIKNETAEYHCLASELLEIAFFYLTGSYEAALNHTRRAIELVPNNIGYQEKLLLFNDYPEKIVSDEEAVQVARNILLQESDNIVAKDYLAAIKKN